jgi:hypothetical protein
MKFNARMALAGSFLLAGTLVDRGASAQELSFETLGKPAQVVADPQEASQLPPLTQNQWARIGVNGELVGRVSLFASDGLALAGPGMMVKLVSQGRVIGQTQTDPEGQFGFVGVTPGVFTIVAADPRNIAVYAMTAVPADGGPVTELDLIAVSDMDMDRSLAMVAGASRLAGTGKPLAMPVYSAERREVLNTYKVQMTAAGGFRGLVSVPGVPSGQVDLSDMRLRVVRGDRTIAEESVSANGEYSVAGIGPGPAGAIFYGPNGFAAMGIEIVGSEQQITAIQPSTEMLVALQDGGARSLNVDLADVSDVRTALATGPNGPNEIGPPVNPVAPPLGGGAGGGGPGGGFGGGSGGGGGLGGVGGLALVGAAVAAAVALSDDDDDDNFVPLPASPALP